MSQTLVDRRQENKLVERVAVLEEIIQALRANQNQKMYFGNITIDGSGSQGMITLGNGLVLTVDANGNGKITVGNTITITGDANGHGTITVSDGSNTRILIGYQAGGF